MKARFLMFTKYADGSTSSWIIFTCEDGSGKQHNVEITRKEYKKLKAILKSRGHNSGIDVYNGQSYVYYDFENTEVPPPVEEPGASLEVEAIRTTYEGMGDDQY